MVQVVAHHAARGGPAVRAKLTTGEVVATVSNDAMRAGGAFDITARLAGAIASYFVVAIILLSSSSVLGLVVLVGVPVLVLSLSFVIRPLQARQREQREQVGRLTALGADTVVGPARPARDRRRAGLPRPLPEPLRAGAPRGRSRRAAAVHARLGAGPAARDLRRHRHLARRAARGRGDDQSRRARRLLRLRGLPRHPAPHRGRDRRQGDARVRRREPDAGDPRRSSRRSPSRPRPPPSRRRALPLTDRRSGLVVEPGLLTCIVSAVPQEGVELVDRLGRFVDDDGVLLGGVPLESLPLEAVRRRIVVSETDPMLFSGPLQEELDPWGRATEARGAGGDRGRERGGRARRAARRARTGSSRSAGARSREVSGSGSSSPARCSPTPRSCSSSTRRARSTPTPRRGSPRRLREARRGRTTVILTASPLVLDQAERVVFLEDGAVAAIGTHRELLQSAPAYRATVTREEARMSERLPIADGPEVRAHAAALFRQHRRALSVVLGLHALAAVAGLAGPRLLGELVQAVEDGTTTSHIDRVVALLAVFVLAQTVLTWFARRASFVLSEQVFARAARGLHEPRPRAAALDRRAGRHRRPRLAHDCGRRLARAHGAVRDPRDDDRGGDDGADGRRGGPRQPDRLAPVHRRPARRS